LENRDSQLIQNRPALSTRSRTDAGWMYW